MSFDAPSSTQATTSRRSFLNTAGKAAALTTGAAALGSAINGPVAFADTTTTKRIVGTAMVGAVTEPGGVAAGWVRFHVGGNPGEWIQLHPLDAESDDLPARGTELMPTPEGAHSVDFRLPADNKPHIIDTGIEHDYRPYNGLPGTGSIAAPSQGTIDLYGLPVITRQGWGCNESWSWGNQINFRRAQVLTVHHAAFPARANRAESVRGIHRYHAVVNGWRDVGYQLLIDPEGRIYQGHSVGSPNMAVFHSHTPFRVPDSVVGAHVGGNNSGNVGICLLGDWSNVAPPAAQVTSLISVLARLSAVLQIDPRGGVHYHNPDSGRTRHMNAITAHREWMSTGCPGDGMYRLMPHVRNAAALQRDTGFIGALGSSGPQGSMGSLNFPIS